MAIFITHAPKILVDRRLMGMSMGMGKEMDMEMMGEKKKKIGNEQTNPHLLLMRYTKFNTTDLSPSRVSLHPDPNTV